MNTEVMKNMVVIKNLPSNVIEEAFVILKPNLKVKELNTVNLEGKEKYRINKEDYVIKEAELLVSEYISKIEKGENIRKNNILEKRYKKLKKITTVSLIFSAICLIMNIIF